MTATRFLGIACTLVLFASPAFAQRWGRAGLPRNGVCFYKDVNFSGDYFCVDSGRDLSSIEDGMNDRISSIRLFGRAELTVYKDRHYSGRSTRITHDVYNLKNEGWNDSISSVRVEGPSTSARDAERIVQRAYQDILQRNPDQDGMRIYRSHIIDDNWSEAQVRDALKKSPEYREKNTMTYPKAQEVVRRAYQNVLKREPDAGSSGYVNKVMRDHWTQADVEGELRKSAEYRKRGG